MTAGRGEQQQHPLRSSSEVCPRIAEWIVPQSLQDSVAGTDESL